MKFTRYIFTVTLKEREFYAVEKLLTQESARLGAEIRSQGDKAHPADRIRHSELQAALEAFEAAYNPKNTKAAV